MAAGTRLFLLRNNKPILVATATVLSILLLFILAPRRDYTCHTISPIHETAEHFSTKQQPLTFSNLNNIVATGNARQNKEHVLILTPLKNAEPYLPRYFELIGALTYPKELISMAFLVSDTTDNTIENLKQYANSSSQSDQPYHSINIYEKDFNFIMPEGDRHQFEVQAQRRKFMARSRNYLLTAGLKNEHVWVLWLDVDVVEYPATVLDDLTSLDVDVVVPNCLLKTDDGSFWGYDKNNWQETEESIDMQKSLNEEDVLVEGKLIAAYQFQRHCLTWVNLHRI
jgi:Anp1